MGKPASRALIGGFVAGGVGLLVIAVVIFGSGKFLSKTKKCVMYFDGSVKGLSVGSPVMFRGVKVGSVTDIGLRYDPGDQSFLIPVTMEFLPEKGGRIVGVEGSDNELQLLIEKGLRAQLQQLSMVTGQVMIDLDMYPDKPAHLVGIKSRYPEIPTITSPFAELLKTAQELPLRELFQKLQSSLAGIDRAVNSPEIALSLRDLSAGVKEAREALAKINEHTGPILASLKDASEDFRSLVRKAEGVPLQIEQTLAAARDSLAQASKTLVSVEGVASDNSVLVHDVGLALEEVANAALSLRVFSEYLQLHPEALLRGKKQGKEE